MAVNSTFYINAADFETATAVYLDSLLTYIAPDGYYSFGTVVRQQSGGILLAVETCPGCSTPCGTETSTNGGSGIYQVNLETGFTTTGAIRIRFNPKTKADGIRVTYNGVVYNKLSSPTRGVVQSANYGHYTILGSSSVTQGCESWYPSGGVLTRNIYLYNPSTGTFDVTTSQQTNDIETDDFFLFSGALVGDCWMVIPKIAPIFSSLLIEVIGPCSGTLWFLEDFCPAELPGFQTSNVGHPSPELACEAIVNTMHYFAKVHTEDDEYIGLYDYVFYDPYGEVPLPDGFYLTSAVASPNKVLEVVNGVVVAITSCT